MLAFYLRYTLALIRHYRKPATQCGDRGFDGPEGDIRHHHPLRVTEKKFPLKLKDHSVLHKRLALQSLARLYPHEGSE